MQRREGNAKRDYFPAWPVLIVINSIISVSGAVVLFRRYVKTSGRCTGARVEHTDVHRAWMMSMSVTRYVTGAVALWSGALFTRHRLAQWKKYSNACRRIWLEIFEAFGKKTIVGLIRKPVIWLWTSNENNFKWSRWRSSGFEKQKLLFFAGNLS